jgi:hypothetical protein
MRKLQTRVLITLLICIGGAVGIALIIQPRMNVLDSKSISLPALPTYTVREISVLCELLAFDANAEFCTNTQTQNAETLEMMLNIHYPTASATYNDLIPRLHEVPSRPSYFCERQLAEETFGYAIDNCPPPSQCTSDYQCAFSLNMSYEIDITLMINIDVETGHMSYRVTRPSESP